jgi:hypothetical protein
MIVMVTGAGPEKSMGYTDVSMLGLRVGYSQNITVLFAFAYSTACPADSGNLESPPPISPHLRFACSRFNKLQSFRVFFAVRVLSFLTFMRRALALDYTLPGSDPRGTNFARCKAQSIVVHSLHAHPGIVGTYISS